MLHNSVRDEEKFWIDRDMVLLKKAENTMGRIFGQGWNFKKNRNSRETCTYNRKETTESYGSYNEERIPRESNTFMTYWKQREANEHMLLYDDCRTVINKYGKCKYYLKKKDSIYGEQGMPN